MLVLGSDAIEMKCFAALRFHCTTRQCLAQDPKDWVTANHYILILGHSVLPLDTHYCYWTLSAATGHSVLLLDTQYCYWTLSTATGHSVLLLFTIAILYIIYSTYSTYNTCI